MTYTTVGEGRQQQQNNYHNGASAQTRIFSTWITRQTRGKGPHKYQTASPSTGPKVLAPTSRVTKRSRPQPPNSHSRAYASRRHAAILPLNSL